MHPVAIPLLHQHSACSLENTIAIVGNGRFGPPFPSNTASIWTGSKNLQECWGVASLYVLSRQDVLAMGQGGKLSKDAIGAEFAQSAQSAPAMSNVLIEKKGVAVGGAEDSHRKAEGSPASHLCNSLHVGACLFWFCLRARVHCSIGATQLAGTCIHVKFGRSFSEIARLVQGCSFKLLFNRIKFHSCFPILNPLFSQHHMIRGRPHRGASLTPCQKSILYDNSGWKLKVNIPVLQGRNAAHVYWWFTSIQLGPWARLFSALKKVCTTFQQPQVMLVKKISRAQAIQEAAATSKNNQNDQHSLRCKFGGASPASSVLAIAGNFGWKHEWVSGCGQ